MPESGPYHGETPPVDEPTSEQSHISDSSQPQKSGFTKLKEWSTRLIHEAARPPAERLKICRSEKQLKKCLMDETMIRAIAEGSSDKLSQPSDVRQQLVVAFLNVAEPPGSRTIKTIPKLTPANLVILEHMADDSNTTVGDIIQACKSEGIRDLITRNVGASQYYCINTFAYAALRASANLVVTSAHERDEGEERDSESDQSKQDDVIDAEFTEQSVDTGTEVVHVPTGIPIDKPETTTSVDSPSTKSPDTDKSESNIATSVAEAKSRIPVESVDIPSQLLAVDYRTPVTITHGPQRYIIRPADGKQPFSLSIMPNIITNDGILITFAMPPSDEKEAIRAVKAEMATLRSSIDTSSTPQLVGIRIGHDPRLNWIYTLLPSEELNILLKQKVEIPDDQKESKGASSQPELTEENKANLEEIQKTIDDRSAVTKILVEDLVPTDDSVHLPTFAEGITSDEEQLVACNRWVNEMYSQCFKGQNLDNKQQLVLAYLTDALEKQSSERGTPFTLDQLKHAALSQRDNRGLLGIAQDIRDRNKDDGDRVMRLLDLEAATSTEATAILNNMGVDKTPQATKSDTDVSVDEAAPKNIASTVVSESTTVPEANEIESVPGPIKPAKKITFNAPKLILDPLNESTQAESPLLHKVEHTDQPGVLEPQPDIPEEDEDE